MQRLSNSYAVDSNSILSLLEALLETPECLLIFETVSVSQSDTFDDTSNHHQLCVTARL